VYASARVAAIQIACMSAFARACCDFGSALSTLPILWNLFRGRNKFHYAEFRIRPMWSGDATPLAVSVQ
jgi:hypothetical protein